MTFYGKSFIVIIKALKRLVSCCYRWEMFYWCFDCFTLKSTNYHLFHIHRHTQCLCPEQALMLHLLSFVFLVFLKSQTINKTLTF